MVIRDKLNLLDFFFEFKSGAVCCNQCRTSALSLTVCFPGLAQFHFRACSIPANDSPRASRPTDDCPKRRPLQMIYQCPIQIRAKLTPMARERVNTIPSTLARPSSILTRIPLSENIPRSTPGKRYDHLKIKTLRPRPVDRILHLSQHRPAFVLLHTRCPIPAHHPHPHDGLPSSSVHLSKCVYIGKRCYFRGLK